MSSEPRIPYSVVIWLLGLSFSCGGLFFQTMQNTKMIDAIHDNEYRIQAQLANIDQRLSIIQGKLEVLK